jgi:hypothetical protein
MNRLVALVLTGLLVATAAPAAAAPPAEGERLRAYTADVGPGRVRELRSQGYDVAPGAGARGRAAELILTDDEAAELRREGIELELEGGETARTAQAATPEGAGGVFRPYSGPGGIEEELRRLTADRPDLAKLVKIGESVQGKDILAVKLTRGATRVPDGVRPASLYLSTQHAREWITPEMTRRLLHHLVDAYGTDGEITQLLNRNELWFVVVANPDGYDHTFTEGNRLWRKNLRDNDGDGEITGVDGVDPNRNFPYKWGYDNEGSSPDPSDATYRGTGPASEPETQALIGLFESVDFRFLVNYHSAAQLNLYGIGWQVATPSPDDALSVALAGTDQQAAIPGYDPDISAELYTTNGETTEHAHEVHGIVGFTPEMSTCQTISAQDPEDEWLPEDCESVFNFPDDEELIQAEFEKNIPFALDIARSTRDPDDPVSHQGRTAPDFELDTFDVSYGDPQTVQVNAKREVGPVVMEYRVNGGRRQLVRMDEWEGGERYGGSNDLYYHYVRGEVAGARPGDEVSVTFRGSRGARSDTFTYTVAQDSGNRVLVLANEDYDGYDPGREGPGQGTAPAELETYAASLEANGIGYDVWDADAQGAPDPLGVLSHYDAVVWYTGDNVITQDEEDTDVLGLDDLGVADVQQSTTIAVRDFLNEGGKLLHTGDHAGYFGSNGVLFYADDDDPSLPCAPEGSIFDDCLLYSDDFYQYYLGAYSRLPFAAPETVTGLAAPLEAETITVEEDDGADAEDEAGQFVVTSDVLPPEQFPWFGESVKSSEYVDDAPDPTQPLSGEYYVGAPHANDTYARLSRTIDLTGASSAQLRFALSYNVEAGYDHVIVEARTVGQDDWTTLPDAEGRATNAIPTDCEAGFLLGLHPFLANYLTLADGACTPTGATGAWYGFTGTSGWGPATFDLSPYAGRQVEVAVSYVSDPATGGTGAFVDDTVLTVDGTVAEENGFEDGLEPWAAAPPPEGSPAGSTSWERSTSLVPPLDLASSVTTEDTVYLGFGFETIAAREQRDAVLGRVMAYLLGG